MEAAGRESSGTGVWQRKEEASQESARRGWDEMKVSSRMGDSASTVTHRGNHDCRGQNYSQPLKAAAVC